MWEYQCNYDIEISHVKWSAYPLSERKLQEWSDMQIDFIIKIHARTGFYPKPRGKLLVMFVAYFLKNPNFTPGLAYRKKTVLSDLTGLSDYWSFNIRIFHGPSSTSYFNLTFVMNSSSTSKYYQIWLWIQGCQVSETKIVDSKNLKKSDHSRNFSL